MGAFEHFPYANFHDLNLDWILGVVKGIPGDVKAAQDEMRPTVTVVNITPDMWVQDPNGYYAEKDLSPWRVPTDGTLNVGLAGGATKAQYNAASASKLAVESYLQGILRMRAFNVKPAIDIPVGVMWWR